MSAIHFIFIGGLFIDISVRPQCIIYFYEQNSYCEWW